MAKIRWTREAEIWLQEIHDYIADDNPIAATQVANGIYRRAQELSEFPKIGHLYEIDEIGEVRILLYGHYRIAYLIKNEESVDILGVFHGALDIKKFLE